MEYPRNWWYTSRMRLAGQTLTFLAGVAVGAAGAAAVVSGGWFAQKAEPVRSAQDDAIYDGCLAAKNGNTVACDAIMRMLERERTAEAAMKVEAAKMLAAGVSKRDVVKWAIDKGFVGSQLSDAVGNSLRDLQTDNY